MHIGAVTEPLLVQGIYRGTSLSDCQICMHLALGPNRPQRFKPTAMHITLGRENCRLVCKLGTTLHSSLCTRTSVEFRAYSSWSTKLASLFKPFPPTVSNAIFNSQVIFEIIINRFIKIKWVFFIATCFDSARIQKWKYLKFSQPLQGQWRIDNSLIFFKLKLFQKKQILNL